MRSLIINQKGFALTEALVSSALLGALFISIFMGFEKINQHQKLNSQLQSSELIKNSLYSILNNPTAWKNTQNSSSNSVFNCLSSNSCKGKVGYINEVKTANNSTYFKDTGFNGFKANGQTCVSTSSNPDPSCFLTVKLKVSFLCDDECKSPLVKVEGKFTTLNKKITGFGSNFNFELLKSVKSDPCALGCKTVTFNPTVLSKKSESLETSDLKIILIVDNSSSMKAAQEYLNTGLKTLFAKLKSLNINSKVYIYTTTQLGSDKTFPVASDNMYYKWEDKYGILHEGTDKPYLPNILDFEAISRPLIQPPVGGKELSISKDMTDADFEQVLAQMDKILTSSEGIGTNGSSNEQGICTVAKTMFDNGPNAFFSQGDNTLFLIVSDENDISESNCFAQVSESYDCDDKYGGQYSLYGCDYTPGPTRAETCDRVRYMLYEDEASNFTAHRQVYYQCVKKVTEDGVDKIISDYESNLNRNYTGRCSDENYGSGVCNDKDLNQILVVKNDCSAEGEAITDCKTGCWESNNKPYEYLDTDKATMSYDLTKKSFTDSGGASHADLFAYMEKKYPGKTFLREKYYSYGEKWKPYCRDNPKQTVSYQELMGLDPEKNSLKEVIKQKADDLFGADGYSMSLIINDKDLNAKAGCSLQGDQSYGTEYKDFANSLSIKGSVSSICSADYSDALNNVSEFAAKVANEAKKTISLNEGEMVLKITTTDTLGGETILSSPKDYSINGLVITFTDEFIKQSTSPVNVEIAKAPPKVELMRSKWIKSAKK